MEGEGRNVGRPPNPREISPSRGARATNMGLHSLDFPPLPPFFFIVLLRSCNFAFHCRKSSESLVYVFFPLLVRSHARGRSLCMGLCMNLGGEPRGPVVGHGECSNN